MADTAHVRRAHGRCDSCGGNTAVRHTGARWLCDLCWSRILGPKSAGAR